MYEVTFCKNYHIEISFYFAIWQSGYSQRHDSYHASKVPYILYHVTPKTRLKQLAYIYLTKYVVYTD